MTAYAPLIRRSGLQVSQAATKPNGKKAAPSHANKRATSSYPHASTIQSGLGVRLPGAWNVDAEECRRRGVRGFTDGLMTTFESPQPTLHVAAHEAVHRLQHAGLTHDYGLGPEGHANVIANELEDGRQASQMIDNSFGARVTMAVRPYTEDSSDEAKNSVQLRNSTEPSSEDIAFSKAAHAEEIKHYAMAVRRYELEMAQYRLSQSQGVDKGILNQQHAALRAFHHALEVWHADLAAQKAEFRAGEEQVRAFEGGGPEWGNISGRNRNRAEGWVKLWGGISMTVGTLGLSTAVGGDFAQAGGRQLITGKDESTAVRAGVSWASQKQGYSPRAAKTHGEIAEFLLPLALTALQLGRELGRAPVTPDLPGFKAKTTPNGGGKPPTGQGKPHTEADETSELSKLRTSHVPSDPSVAAIAAVRDDIASLQSRLEMAKAEQLRKKVLGEKTVPEHREIMALRRQIGEKSEELTRLIKYRIETKKPK